MHRQSCSLRGTMACIYVLLMLGLIAGQGCPGDIAIPAAFSSVGFGATVSATSQLQVGEIGSGAATIFGATGNLTYAWTISAPGEIVGSASDLVVAFKGNAPATVTLALTVTDSGTGFTNTSSAVVQVLGPAEPLAADAGADATVQVGNTVLLNGKASGGTNMPGWSNYSYMWRQVSGPFQQTAPDFVPSSQALTVIGTTPGEAVFALLVQDQAGATAMDTIQITVMPAPN